MRWKGRQAEYCLSLNDKSLILIIFKLARVALEQLQSFTNDMSANTRARLAGSSAILR